MYRTHPRIMQRHHRPDEDYIIRMWEKGMRGCEMFGQMDYMGVQDVVIVHRSFMDVD